MSLTVFQTLSIGVKIDLVTLMEVNGVSRYRGYQYLGIMPYTTAKYQAVDPVALVAATRAYFREGSKTNYAEINYVALQKDNNSPVILIPEPLVQSGSVVPVQTTVTTIVINGSYQPSELSVILSSNGVTDFKINQEFLS